MEKWIYVVWKRPELQDPEFVAAMLGETARRLSELGATGLTLNLVDEVAAAVAKARITRLDPPPSGMLSFRVDRSGARDPIEVLLSETSRRWAGYLVSERVALANTTHRAPLGARTPGINMVALIRRPDWLEREAWLERWLGPHRQVALETQCTYAYVRNVVERALGAGAPAWDGIVEEGFPRYAVTDAMRWYRANGSPETLRANLERMLESCKRFLDLDRVESHPMSEYRISA